jgi:2'-5' RNA ligase
MSEPLRLFVAWWPGPRTHAALVAEQAAWGWPAAARPARADGLHITLHFLGATDAAHVPALIRCLRALPAVRDAMRFTQRQIWPQGVAVLAPARVPASAVALHGELGRQLIERGCPPDPRPWRPHLTLARHARDALVPMQPLDLHWPLGRPVLVHSVPGPQGGYRRLG